MESTPKWADLLESLYREGEFTHEDIEIELARDDEIIEKHGLDTGPLKRPLSFLMGQNLIEPNLGDDGEGISEGYEPSVLEFRLTEDGFEVAQEWEMSRSQDQLTRMMLLLTVGLFTTAIVEALGAVYSVDGVERTMMVLGMTLLVGVTIILLWRAGWFD